MDPNTLNLNPDPGFWPNLELDLDAMMPSILKEKFQLFLVNHNFLTKVKISLGHILFL